MLSEEYVGRWASLWMTVILSGYSTGWSCFSYSTMVLLKNIAWTHEFVIGFDTLQNKANPLGAHDVEPLLAFVGRCI